MDLLQLKYFCHAAATQNFAKTAEAFHVPPSNISHCIKRLEDELQTALFDRTANRVELNRQGQFFYEGIREALDLIENTTQGLHDPANSGTIRIAVQLNMNIVMRAINRFRQQYPGVDIATTRYRGSLPDGDFDLIVSNDAPTGDTYDAELVLHDRIYLIAHKGLLSPGPAAAVDEIRELPYISMEKGSLMHRDTLNICSHLGFSPRIILHSESSNYLPVCVEQKIGVALLPLLCWSWSLNQEIIDIKDIGDFYRDTFLHRRKRRHIPQVVTAFQEVLKDEFARKAAGTPL